MAVLVTWSHWAAQNHTGAGSGVRKLAFGSRVPRFTVFADFSGTDTPATAFFNLPMV